MYLKAEGLRKSIKQERQGNLPLVCSFLHVFDEWKVYRLISLDRLVKININS